MEFHLMIEPHNGGSYDEQLALAVRAEQLGFDGLFRADHYLPGTADRVSDWLTDTWVTLAGLARDTHRIALGSLMSSATFRSPVQLAISCAQVDAMSGGRVELGIGAGWWQQEHDAVGIALPPMTERFDRFAEQLAIITGLWQTSPREVLRYQGRYYQLAGAVGVRCLRAGGPPIIIGGSGRQRTPALAVRYAAEFNSGWLSPAETALEYRRVIELAERSGRQPATLRLSTVQTLCIGRDESDLQRRAATLGLDLDELRRTGAGIHGTPDEAARRVADYHRLGTGRLYLELLDLTDHEQLELWVEQVLPRFQQAMERS